MVDKTSIREDVRKDSSRILYEDDRYLIGVSSREANSHNLLVNEAYAFLDRGIFNELARADVKRLKTSLQMIGERVLREIEVNNIPLEELGWALAKAEIRNQEYLSTHYS